jgi:hypothetical protein
MTVTPEARIWNLLRGALATRALAIAADLRIADALADSPRAVTELAGQTGADPDTLQRLLRALASDGVFAEAEPGVFENTDASEVLRSGGGWDALGLTFPACRTATDEEMRPATSFSNPLSVC